MLRNLQVNQNSFLSLFTSKSLFLVLILISAAFQTAEACDNVTYGGKIGSYEVKGGTFIASTITSEEDPTGGWGTIQYMWLKSNDPTLPWSQWTAINGADDSTYEPGEITETTYFLRCSRRQGCTYWDGESNIIAKIINGSGIDCDGNTFDETIGAVIAVTGNNDVDYQENIEGAIDEAFARLYDTDDYLIIEMKDQLAVGEQVTVSWKSRNYSSSFSGNSQMIVSESVDGINFTYNTTLETSLKTIIVHQTVTLNSSAKFLKLALVASTPDFDVDAVSYNIRTCTKGSIGNRVWEDLNGNGLQDDGEPGLQGVFVFLEDEFGNPIPGVDFEYTDSEGAYLFENLPLAKYKVRFATPGGYLPTGSKQGLDSTIDSDASYLDGRSDLIDLTINQNDTTIDAGYVMPIELVGIVWYDDDNNGLQEDGDIGVEGVFVTLYDAGEDMIADTDDDVKFGDFTTGADGYYTFNNVIAGKYYVVFDKETLPLGYSFTNSNIGMNDYLDSDADKESGLTPVFMITSGEDKSGVDAGVVLTCGFIPDAKIGDAKCEGFPVDFEADPNEAGYTYFWQFLDDVTNPVIIGESTDRTTDFTWLTPGEKIYKLTVSNQDGCSVTKTGTFTVLSADEAVCQNILPVELIDFTANIINNNEVQLKWSTAWEQNNDLFEVQRSIDGERFEAIGVVYGMGTSELVNHYKFIDETPFYGRNYYRLKQIDFDGTVDFSGTISVLISNEELPDVILYPNPTKDVTTLRVVTPFEENATVEIVNASGQILEIISVEAGVNSQEIDLRKYQPGFYFLNIKYNGFKTLVQRVLKVRD